MTQYQEKPKVIDATQWDGTADGFAILQEIGPVGMSYDSGTVTVYVPIVDGVYMQPHDWLCKDYFGIYSVVRAADFNNLYQIV